MSTDRAVAPISITLPPLPRIEDRLLVWAAIGLLIDGVGDLRFCDPRLTDGLLDQWNMLADSILATRPRDLREHAAQVVVALADGVDELDPLFAQLRKQAISILTGKEQTDAF